MCSGSGTACADGSTIYSAAVPCGRRHCPFQTQTRSPTRLATPGPTLSISPAPSLCGMISGADIGAVRAAARLPIGGVHPRGLQVHAHLAGPGFGLRPLANLQQLARRSLLHIICSLHSILQSEAMSKAIPKEFMALLKEAGEMFSETGCVPGIDREEVPAETIVPDAKEYISATIDDPESEGEISNDYSGFRGSMAQDSYQRAQLG